MYQIPKKKRHGKLWLFLCVCSVIAIGFGVGMAAVKMNPFPNHISTEPKKTPPGVFSPTPSETSEEENQLVSGTAELTEEETKTPRMPPKEGYLVQVADGKVCVFKIAADGSTKFSHNIAVALNDLPDADREKLTKGIYVETKTELAELTEDYSS